MSEKRERKIQRKKKMFDITEIWQELGKKKNKRRKKMSKNNFV